MFKINIEISNQKENRLVWMALGESPSTPQSAESNEKSKEQLDAEKSENAREIAEIVKDLDISKTKIEVKEGKSIVVQFKEGLESKIKGLNMLGLKRIKNLDVFLINGLAENLGINKKNLNDSLNEWLKSKNVKSFEIQKGYWVFYDNEGQTVKENYKLDDKTEEVDKAVISKDVGDLKKTSESTSGDPSKLAESDDKKKGEGTEQKQDDADKSDDGRWEKTKYDDIQKRVAEKIFKEGAEGNNADFVDTRYLGAAEQILDYPGEGVRKVSIPFNDSPLECEFYKGQGNNNYFLKWSETGFYKYVPVAKEPKAALEEAKLFYLLSLNDGRILREIQVKNINKKENFELWGMTVDSGPNPVKGKANTVHYEFDWATGLGGDPDVYITVLPHGELQVEIDQSDILPSGEKYSYKAGGFQDMMRYLKSLQQFAEAPKDKKVQLQVEEMERRSLYDNMNDLPDIAQAFGAGKLLRVNSIGLAGVESKDAVMSMESGFKLDFDWMQKLNPTMSLLIKKSGNGYELTIQPYNQRIGVIGMPIRENLTTIMIFVKQQRENWVGVGSQDKMNKSLNDLLIESYRIQEGGEFVKVQMSEGVKVKAVAEGNFYLSKNGTVPRLFHFGNKEHKNLGEIKRAIEQGYLIYEGQFSEKPTEPQEKPKDKISITVDRAGVETGRSTEGESNLKEHQDVTLKDQVISEIVKKVVSNKQMLVRNYLVGRILDFNADNGDEKDRKSLYLNYCWEKLAEFSGVVISSSEIPISQENQTKILAKINGKEKYDEKINKKLEGFGLEKPLLTKLSKLPQTRSFIYGLLIQLDGINGIEGLDDKNLGDAKKKYKEELKIFFNKYLGKGVKDLKSFSQKQDKEVRDVIIGTLRNINSYFTDYAKNQKLVERQEKYNKEMNEYIDRQKPHKMSYLEWSNGSFDNGSLADTSRLKWSEARSAGVYLENVYLSNLPENGKNPNEIKFNIFVDNREFTITVYKTNSGELRVGINDGWNNQRINMNKPLSFNTNPIKAIIDLYIKGTSGSVLQSYDDLDMEQRRKESEEERTASEGLGKGEKADKGTDSTETTGEEEKANTPSSATAEVISEQTQDNDEGEAADAIQGSSDGAQAGG